MSNNKKKHIETTTKGNNKGQAKTTGTLDSTISKIVIKSQIDKLNKRPYYPLQKIQWIVRNFMKDKDYNEQIKMDIVSVKIYKKHKSALRQKLFRIKNSKQVIELQEKYPNLKIIEALQLLSLYDICELHKATNINIFVEFLSVLFNEKQTD